MEPENSVFALPYIGMAERIVKGLDPETGERVIIRFDPGVLSGFPEVLKEALAQRKLDIELLRYGPVSDFRGRLENTDIYIWLPSSQNNAHSSEELNALGEWLDSGRGREIHFHWGDGTRTADGLAADHSLAYDEVYVAALEIDYEELNRRQDQAIATLKSGEVRVTTPAGTDVRFRVGDLPFDKQNGDASKKAVALSQIRNNREIEFPSGVIRVAPMEETVHGIIVTPIARFEDEEVENLKLVFEEGKTSGVTASSSEAVVRRILSTSPELCHFGEFGLGFNPKLKIPHGYKWIPYFGYGAGIVRLSLGDNTELGGRVRGKEVRWFFLQDASVTVGQTTLVEQGRLVV